ncbi:hypothetical protein DQ240_07265 [Blastococcus sp. TF02A-26]|nr:hypothetical protein DQ240_07265 [Blastococcus sp. TF02A-26]
MATGAGARAGSSLEGSADGEMEPGSASVDSGGAAAGEEGTASLGVRGAVTESVSDGVAAAEDRAGAESSPSKAEASDSPPSAQAATGTRTAATANPASSRRLAGERRDARWTDMGDPFGVFGPQAEHGIVCDV